MTIPRWALLGPLTLLLSACAAHHPLSDTGYSVATWGDLWSPSVTLILGPDGQILHVIGGESAVGQISTGAGIAVSGALIGEGLREQDGDNLSAGAVSGASATVISP